MFVNFGEKEVNFVLPIDTKIRQAGVRAGLYPEAAKMKKRMSYADSKQITVVAIVGESEMNEGKVNLKNMLSGEQELLTPDELIAKITQ